MLKLKPVILSVSNGGPLYLRLQDDVLLLFLVVEDPGEHLVTISQQTRGESLAAEVSLVIILKCPGSVRVLEQREKDMTMLTGKWTLHIADPSNLADHKAEVLLLGESPTRAGVEVAGDGQIKALDITGLET